MSSPTRCARVEDRPGGSHALLQVRDFNENRTHVNVDNLTRVSPGSIHRDQLLQEGDVIFLAKGAKNFSFVPTGLPRPALVASSFFILRPNGRVAPSYLAWFLNLEKTKRHLARYATQGAHMPVIRRDTLEDLEIPLPDLETQEKIIGLDSLAHRQTQLLARLAEKKLTLATAACLRAAHHPTIQDHR